MRERLAHFQRGIRIDTCIAPRGNWFVNRLADADEFRPIPKTACVMGHSAMEDMTRR